MSRRYTVRAQDPAAPGTYDVVDPDGAIVGEVRATPDHYTTGQLAHLVRLFASGRRGGA